MKYLKYSSLLTLFLLVSCEEPVSVTPTTMEKADFGQAKPTEIAAWPFIDENENNAISPNLLSKNIYIVFDGSGSMADRGCSGASPKINVARTAFNEFLASVPEDANVGLHVFDISGNREVVSLSTHNRDSLTQAISKVVPRSGTPLGPAIKNAYKRITLQAKNQLGYGEYHIVVITDGIANAGHEPDDIIDTILSESPVIVHTVGFCIGTRHTLNRPGEVYYKAATDKKSLAEGLQAVLAESPDYAIVDF